MSNRIVVWCVTAALVGAAVVPGFGQEPGETWEPPRLADGRPDLQGVWDFRTATPFERPEGLGETLTEEQAAAVESFAAAAQQSADRPPAEGNVGAYNAFWLDFGTSVGDDRRSSLIVEPANGRMPELVEDAARQAGSLDVDVPGERPWRCARPASGPTAPRTAASPSGASSASTRARR